MSVPSISNEMLHSVPLAVVLTAIDPERDAVLECLEEREPALGVTVPGQSGVFRIDEKRAWKIVVLQTRPGNEPASDCTTKAIEALRPTIILFIGTAGGLSEKVKLGDVIIVEQVFNYESGRMIGNSFQPAPDVYRSSYELLTAANRINTKNGGFPVQVGTIASGEKVLTQMSAEDVAWIKALLYVKTLAVDTETHGFLKAAHAHSGQVMAIAIRGISDLIEGDKRIVNAQGSKELACRNASAFAFELLTQIYDGHARRLRTGFGNIYDRNRQFVGRKGELDRLREALSTDRVDVLTVLHGLGGMGKTELAIEYAHKYAHEYGGGRWQVLCEGKKDLRAALAELAEPLGIQFTDYENGDENRKFHRVLAELRRLTEATEPHQCLLLLDNVDRPALLEPAQIQFLPSADWLHVIATTQLGENELYKTHQDRSFVPVDELPEAEALALIENYQPNHQFRDDVERESAREIVTLLGRFTLAVETAAVYLGHFAADVNCAAFLARLKKEGLKGLELAAGESNEGVRHGEKRVSATLGPMLQRLNKPTRLALTYAVLLPADQIPLPWIRALVGRKYPEFGKDAEPGHTNPWMDLLRTLFSLRLLKVTGVNDAEGQPLVVRMHWLVQQCVSDTHRWGFVRRLLDGLYRILSKITRKWITSLSPRVFAVHSHVFKRSVWLCKKEWPERADCWEIEPINQFTLCLLDKGGRYGLNFAILIGHVLFRVGRYADATQLYRKALQVSETLFGPEARTSLAFAGNLASALEKHQGDFAAAVGEHQRVMQAVMRRSGANNPQTLTRANNLGTALLEQGKVSDAEPLLRNALLSCVKVYGPDHRDTLIALNSFACVLERKGDLGAAESLFRRAVETGERLWGPENPATLVWVNNLAGLLQAKGDLSEAERLFRQAFETGERVLGPESPDTLIWLNNLAGLLAMKGEKGGLAEAELHYRRVCETAKRVLGTHHPTTIGWLGNLAGVLEAKRDLSGAELVYRDILDYRTRRFGPEGAETVATANTLAKLLEAKGDFDAAETEYQRILKQSPTDFVALGNYAFFLQNVRRDFDSAQVLYLRALQADQQDAVNHANYAGLCLVSGKDKWDEAHAHLFEAWSLRPPQPDRFTARILFLRTTLAALQGDFPDVFLGQLKAVFDCGIRPAPSRNITVLERLRESLSAEQLTLFQALYDAINEQDGLARLHEVDEWTKVDAVSLDTPWPNYRYDCAPRRTEPVTTLGERNDTDPVLIELTQAMAAAASNLWERDLRAKLHAEKYDLVVADTTQALEYGLREAWVYALRGNAHRHQGNFDDSIADLTEAVRIDPTYAWAWADRGMANAQNDELGAALADFSRAVDIDATYAWAWVQRARVQRAKGKFAAAIADASHALELGVREAWVYVERGSAYRRLEKFDAAIADFTRAVRRNLDYAPAWAGRGLAHCQKGNLEHAIADLSEAVRLDPAYAWAWAERGKVYRQRGDMKRAIVDLKRASEIEPEFAWEWAQNGEGSYYEALESVDSIVQARVDWLPGRFVRGKLLSVLGRFAEAEKELSACRAMNSNDYAIVLECGFNAWRVGRHEEAVSLFRLARENGIDVLQTILYECIYLMQMRRETSIPQVVAQTAERKRNDPDLEPTIRWIAGEITDEELLGATTTNRDKCGVLYWLAEKARAYGDTSQGNRFITECLETGETTLYEYQHALALKNGRKL